MGSLAAGRARGGARSHATLVDQTIADFMGSLSDATIKSYNRTSNEYYEFILSLDCRYPTFPSKKGQICLFASHLFHQQGLSPAAIMTKMSAISFIHKLYESCDPTKSFMFRKLMVYYRKQKPQQDARLPITPCLLHDMLDAISKMGFSYYDAVLFRSMLTLDFAAFLRVSEMAGVTHHLQHNNVRIIKGKIVIRFTTYKWSKQTGFVLTVRPTNLMFCPVKCLAQYLEIRGRKRGALFLRSNGLPIAISAFQKMFQSVMSFLRMPGTYSAHSLRIGAATHAAAVGYTDAQIRVFGRWSSTAAFNYIKFPVVQV